jgi:hypothetical protein
VASPDEKRRFARLQQGAATPEVIQKFPPYPEDVKRRFPSLVKHEEEVEAWRVKTNIAIRGGPSE